MKNLTHISLDTISADLERTVAEVTAFKTKIATITFDYETFQTTREIHDVALFHDAMRISPVVNAQQFFAIIEREIAEAAFASFAEESESAAHRA